MILAQQSHTPAGSTRQFCPIVLTQAISCHRWYPVSSFPNDTHLGNLRPLVAVLDKFFPNSTCSGYISPPWTVFGNFCPNGTCPDDIKYFIYIKILSSFCRNYTHTSNNESYVGLDHHPAPLQNITMALPQWINLLTSRLVHSIMVQLQWSLPLLMDKYETLMIGK